MPIKTSILSFGDLTPLSLYELLALRNDVFIVEQRCPYQDIDGKDEEALHVLMHDDKKLIAYARILAFDDNVSFGRVLIAQSHRRLNLGKMLVNTVLHHIEIHHPNCPVVISAQLYLQHFYHAFGFTTIKEPFDLDGIPHIWMIKSP